MTLRILTEEHLIPGSAGLIQCNISFNKDSAPIALALIAHPNPLQGGTMDNKVVQTISRALLKMGYVTVRSNFRGVGKTEGVHAEGIGETDDLAAVVAFAKQPYPDLPTVYAGFSFGTFVLVRLHQQMPAQRLVLIGPAVARYPDISVPRDTLIIHSDADEIVAFDDVLAWTKARNLPLTLLPGASHFFHGRLLDLEQVLRQTNLPWINQKNIYEPA